MDRELARWFRRPFSFLSMLQRRQSAPIRRGRPTARLRLELLEDRTLPSGYTLPQVLDAYDGLAYEGITSPGINELNTTNILQPLNGVSIPFLNQTLTSISQLSSSQLGFSAGLPSIVGPSLVSIESLLASLPGAPTDANATWNQVVSVLNTAPFSLVYPTNPEEQWTGAGTPDANGNLNLLEVTYTAPVANPISWHTNVDSTPFQYLNNGFFANFIATAQVSYSVTFGVDIPNGKTSPMFFVMANSSAVTISLTNSISAGTINSSLNIGDLAGVVATNDAAQQVLGLTGSVGFDSNPSSNSLDAGDKLRASDFTGGALANAVQGIVNGSAQLNLNFDAELTGFSQDIPWTGAFSEAIQNGAIQSPSVSLQGPSPSALLGNLGSTLFSLDQDIPILGPLSDTLDQPLPLIGQSIAQLTGLDDGKLPTLPLLPSDFDSLDGSYPLAGGTLTVNVTPTTIEQFVSGQMVNLVSWEASGDATLANFNFDVPIFSIGIPGIASAEIDATFGLNAALRYHVGFGLDSNGMYIDAGTPANPTLGLSFEVDAGLQGQVEVFGFPLASVGGDIGFSVDPYVTLTAPPWAADPSKVYLNDLALFGPNPASDLLDDLTVGIQGDLTGNIYASIDLLFFSISWGWGISIPVFNYERDPSWPAEGEAGNGGSSTWPNATVSGGTLTFTDTPNLNDNISLSDGADDSVTITWAGHGPPQTFTGVDAFDLDGSGSSGNDRLTASPGFDIPIDAYAGSGNDYIAGGTANDSLVGGSGQDTLVAGSGNDTITAGNGTDMIVGGSGSDTLQGGSGSNSIDTIYGGSGSDLIIPENGEESIYGGSGDDTITASPKSTGTYFIDGGSGIYTAQNPEIIDLCQNTGSGDSIYGGTGGDNRIMGSTGGHDLIYGGGPNDTIYGFGGYDTIYGGAGDNPLQPTNNVIYGGDGGYNLIYGAGAGDQLYGAVYKFGITYGGNDTIYGGSGNETIYGGDGQNDDGQGLQPNVTGVWDAAGDNNDPGGNLLVAGSGNDVIFSDANGQNTLTAGAGNDVLWAGNDGDYLAAGTGIDSLYGGPGNDTFQLQFTATGQQPDVIVGGPGNNSLVLKPDAVGAPALLAAINSTTTNFTVTDSAALAGVNASNFVIQIDNEQMLVTQISGDTLTVTRGYNNTTPAPHNAGVAVAVEKPTLVDVPTLASSITNTTSTLTVNDAAALVPTGGPNFVIQVDNEQMLVENIEGNTLTVQRGYDGTSPATHLIGAAVTVEKPTLLVSYPTLVDAITDTTSTGLVVSDAAALSPTGAASFVIQIDNEQMLVTAVNLATNALTVQRGYDNTIAAAHLGGAPVMTSYQPALDPSATTITVTNAALLAAGSTGNFVIQIDQEQMLVTAVSGNTLTVERGYNGTTAAAHFGGTVFGEQPIIQGAVTAAATTLTVSDTAGLAPSGGYDPVIQIDNEQMLVTAVSGNILTVERGYNDTIAASHDSGASITAVIVETPTLVVQNPTLVDALTDTSCTTLTVSDATALAPTGVPNFVIQIDNEQMLVTSISGNTLTVERGYNNTIATTHTVGAPIVTSFPLALDPAATTITVTDAAQLAGGTTTNFVIQIDQEQLLVQSPSAGSDTLTVVQRGYNGTAASAHLAGSSVSEQPTLMSAVGDTLTVSDAAGLAPANGFDSVIQIDNEEMLVTAVSGDTLTVVRGFNNTTVAAHNAGAVIFVAGPPVLDPNATAITVADAAALAPGGAANFVIRIDQEQMLVTWLNTSTGVLTVERGYDGTTASTHAAGACVFLQNPLTQSAETLTGNTTAGSTTISGLTGTSALTLGELVSGAGIPVNTTIVAISSATSSITISGAATATASAVALGFGGTNDYEIYLTVPAQANSNEFQATLSNLDTGETLGQINFTMPADVANLELEGGPGNNWIQVDPSVTKFVSLYGGPGYNTLMGGSGDDTLVAGPGTSVLYGGTGNDILYGGDTPGQGAIPESGTIANGSNVVNFVAPASTAGLTIGQIVTGSTVPNGTTITAILSNNQVTLSNAANAAGNVTFSTATDTVEGHDTLIAGSGNDSLLAGSGGDVLIGGSVARQVSSNGTPGLAIIQNGQYQLVDGAGQDVLTGGSGTDLLIAGPGSPGEILEAGSGDDTLVAQNYGLNVLSGGSGDSLLLGGNLGNVLISNSAATGSNTLVGGLGIDTLLAGEGNDVLYASYNAAAWTQAETTAAADGIHIVPPSIFQGDTLADAILTLLEDEQTQPAGLTSTQQLQFITDLTQEFDSLATEENNLNTEVEKLLATPNLSENIGVVDQLQTVLNQDKLVQGEVNDLLTQLLGALGLAGGFDEDSLVGGHGSDTFYGNVQGPTWMGGGTGNQTFYNYNGNDTIVGGYSAQNPNATDSVIFQGDGNFNLQPIAVTGQQQGVDVETATETASITGNTITGLASTAGFYVGQFVTGGPAGFIPSGTLIQSIQPNGLVTLTNNATTSATGVSFTFGWIVTSSLGINTVGVQLGSGDDTVTAGDFQLAALGLYVKCGSGNDNVYASEFPGTETLLAGSGQDLIQIGAGLDSSSSIQGNTAADSELDILDSTSDTSVTLGKLNGTGPETLQIGGVALPNFTGFQTLKVIDISTAGGDTFKTDGSVPIDVFEGGAGNDTFCASGGNDTLIGGSGSNEFNLSGAGNYNVVGGLPSAGIGSATFTNGSATVTFASSQTLTTGEDIRLNSDGTWYQVAAGGAGTNFTIATPYAGPTNTGAWATSAGNSLTFAFNDSDADVIHLSQSGSASSPINITGTIGGGFTNFPVVGTITGTATNMTSVSLLGGAGDDLLDASGMVMGVTINGRGVTTIPGTNLPGGQDTMIGGAGNNLLVAAGDGSTYDGGPGTNNALEVLAYDGQTETMYDNGVYDSGLGIFHPYTISNIESFVLDNGGDPNSRIARGDGDFPSSQWVVSDSSSTAVVDSATTQQVLTGGNPGAFVQGTDETSGREVGSLEEGYFEENHLFTGYTYDPQTEGPITYISPTFDIELLGISPYHDGNANPPSFGFLLEQGGKYWYSPDLLTLNAYPQGWLHSSDFFNAELTGSDFSPSPPDFSASGLPIQFGFYVNVDDYALGSLNSFSWGLDNFSVFVANNQSPETVANGLPLYLGPGPILAGATNGSAIVTITATGLDTNGISTSAKAAVIDWGDGTSSSGTISWPSGPPDFFSVTGSHIYAVGGDYSPTVSIVDSLGAAVTGSSASSFTAGLTVVGGCLESSFVDPTTTLITVLDSAKLEGTPIESQPVVRESDSTIFDVHTDNSLWVIPASGSNVELIPPSTQVKTTLVGLGSDGNVYVLAGTDLYSIAPSATGPWNLLPVQSNVQAMVQDNNGILYQLDSNGYLYVLQGGAGWTLAQCNVERIAPAGALVDVVQTDGDSWQYSGTAGILLGGPKFCLSFNPTTATAGKSTCVTLNIYDQFGNLVTGYSGTVQFTSTDAAAVAAGGPLPDYVFSSANGGSYAFPTTFLTAGTQTITAADGNGNIKSASLVVVPGTAALFSIDPITVVPGTSTTFVPTAGTSITVTVTAYDAFGNVATAFAGTPTLTSPNAAIAVAGSPTSPEPGVFTYNVTFDTAGGDKLVATYGTGASLITGSGSVLVTAATADPSHSTVTVSTGATLTVGTTAVVTLTARDLYGNQETTGGQEVSFNVTSGPGGGSFGPVADNGDGTYSAIFTATTMGNCVIGAYIGGLAISNSASATLAVVANTTVTLTDNGSTLSALGQAVSFTIAVGPNIPSGETVTLKDASNGNAVVSTQTLTNGTVTFSVSDLSVGLHILFAVYGGDSTNSPSQSSQVSQSVYVLLDTGGPGFSTTGSGWLPYSGAGYDGNILYTLGNTGSTASWTASVAPGAYNVEMSWFAYSNRNTNTTYAVYDGSVLLGTVQENQQLVPAGGTTLSGTPFQSLGIFTITSGTLTVVLSDAGTGHVVADAMFVQPAAPATVDLNWTGVSLNGPATLLVGTPFTLGRSYTISGAAAPGPFAISYYASTSPTFGSNSVFLGTETIAAPSLAVGTYSGTSPSFEITVAGTYYLFAELNGSFAFAQTSDATNVIAVASSVAVSGALVDTSSPGFSTTGPGWLPYSGAGYDGSLLYTLGNTGSAASWTASVAPGTYNVQMSWFAYSNRNTNTTYAVYDGSALLGTVQVNQQLVPAGGATLSGTPFQSLGLFTIASGTLTVVLSDAGTGHVVADTMFVEPAAPASVDLSWTGVSLNGPNTLLVGTPFTLSRSYTISGAAAPGPFEISYYASTSPTFGSSAVLLGTETISAPSLAVGTYSGTSPSFQIIVAGTYYLFAELNGTFAFAQTSDANNVMAVAAPVTVSGALVDTSGPGFSTTGSGWLPYSGAGYDGNVLYTLGNTGSTASWTVSGLAAGSYNVEMSWFAYSNRNTNTTYAVYDGSALLGTVQENQQLVPTGGATLGGTPFQSLGIFTITSGSLTVVLSDAGIGHVVADAMFVQPAAAATVDLNWTGVSLNGPHTLLVGTPFTLSRSYTISGAAAPGPFEISYYASTSPTFSSSSAVLLGTETISAPSLAVGTYSGTSPSFQIPVAGTYYLFAELNGTFAFAQTSDANNVLAAASPVTVNGALVDTSGPGFSTTGSGWLPFSGAGYDGSILYTLGNTGSTASWTVSGLAAGSYNVEMSWFAYSNRNTNTTYAVYDGSVLLGTVQENQQLVPTGGATLGGTPFQSLGIFTIASGTLTVVLSDAGIGHVVADAMFVEPAAPATVDLSWTGVSLNGPTTLLVGTPFTLSRTYTISGAAAPGPFEISYYASTSSTFSSSAVLLGAETISAPSLAVGTYSGISPSFEITVAGTYYLFAELNGTFAFAQTSDANNVMAVASSVTVSGALVDTSSPGFSTTGSGWLPYGGAGYDGSILYTLGNTGSTASWTVSGLVAGSYEVEMSWFAYSNRNTSVAYAVYDGSVLLGTVQVNQQLVPTGGATLGGTPFQSLGIFTIASGSLTVMLSDAGIGHVVADAMFVEPAAPATVDLNWTGVSLNGPTTLLVGTSFTLSRTYTISGAAAPGPFEISYYASASPTFGSSAVLLGTETVSAPSLAVGTYSGPSPSFQITVAGTYYLFAELNSTFAFAQTSDANNVMAVASSVTVGGALVDTSSPGFSTTGSGWLPYSGAGYDGSILYTLGNTGSTASWTVSGLVAGSYNVMMSWFAYSNRATNLTYLIYDNDVLVGTVTNVNQQMTPTGGATVNGTPFQSLGVFAINSGILRVVLSDAGNGHVVADAMFVEPSV